MAHIDGLVADLQTPPGHLFADQVATLAIKLDGKIGLVLEQYPNLTEDQVKGMLLAHIQHTSEERTSAPMKRDTAYKRLVMAEVTEAKQQSDEIHLQQMKNEVCALQCKIRRLEEQRRRATPSLRAQRAGEYLYWKDECARFDAMMQVATKLTQ